MRVKITVHGEGKPLFVIVTSIGGALLAAFAAVIGVTPFERRLILTILFTLFFFSFLHLASFLDRSIGRWHFHGQELYYRYIRRIATQRNQAVAKAHDLQALLDLANARQLQLENELRGMKRDLEERERALGAAQRHIKDQQAEKEEMRLEAQQRINSLKAEIETMKEIGQAKADLRR